MRTVNIFEYDKKERDEHGRYKKKFLKEGFFHKWASAYEEFKNGAGNYEVALVELKDGTMEEFTPNLIQFQSPTT